MKKTAYHSIFKAAPSIRGFTLIETLVVLGIMGLLAGLFVPGFGALFRQKEMARAADILGGSLELARNEAMTKKSFVGLLMANVEENNDSVLALQIIRFQDGTANLESRFSVLAKPRRLENIRLVSLGELGAEVQQKIGVQAEIDSLVDLSTIVIPKPLLISEQSYSHMILFTPQGEAMVPKKIIMDTTPYIAQILIPLCKESQGNLSTSKGDSLGFIIEGSSGAYKIIRP